ncbi:MAG: hypothetical protein WBB67_07110 [bacterium]
MNGQKYATSLTTMFSYCEIYVVLIVETVYSRRIKLDLALFSNILEAEEETFRPWYYEFRGLIDTE